MINKIQMEYIETLKFYFMDYSDILNDLSGMFAGCFHFYYIVIFSLLYDNLYLLLTLYKVTLMKTHVDKAGAVSGLQVV